MAMNDALNRCQSDAGSFELVGAMQPLKYAEKLVDVSHVEPNTVVPHENLRLVSMSTYRANFDRGETACAGELDRIGKQIHKSHPQESPISIADRESTNLPADIL